jgi:hypothetical protein
MEVQVRARREKAAAKRAKEAAADAKPKRCKVPKALTPAQHDAHILAYRPHRILGIVAERLAAPPDPDRDPMIGGPCKQWPPGLEPRPDREQATTMGPGFSPPSVRVPERDIPGVSPLLG